MKKKKYTARISIAFAVPIISVGFGLALIASGIVSPISAQDSDQMPEDVQQDYTQEQELSESFTSAWFIGLGIALGISAFLLVGVLMDKRKQK